MWTASNPGDLPKTILMCALLGACASIPQNRNYDGAAEQVEAPRCIDICWVMSVRNDNYYEARVYISGQRVATLPGMMRKDVGIPITRSMLDGAGCMAVEVKLYPDTKSASSSRQCPTPGSRLELAIAESYGEHPLHLYLQDWRINRK